MKNIQSKLLVKKLIEYIKKRGITQRALAKTLGWSTSDLNDVLRGRKNLGIKRRLHIAKTINIYINTEQISFSYHLKEILEFLKSTYKKTKAAFLTVRGRIIQIAKEIHGAPTFT